MKVDFIQKGGRTKTMDEKHARILQKLGRGTYQTTELRASRPESELDMLRAEADRRGIKYHHRAGVAKLRELLGK